MVNKSKLLVFLSAFFFGFLVSGGITTYLMTHALSQIIEGDTSMQNLFKTNLVKTMNNYNSAEAYWPLLRYNSAFMQKKNEVSKVVNALQLQPAITIFLKDPLITANVSQLTKEIQGIPGVSKTKFISKKDAWAFYKQQNKNDKLLLSLGNADILPASIQVYVSNQTIKSQIEKIAKSKPYVSSVMKSLDY